jgi:hypothetical protein
LAVQVAVAQEVQAAHLMSMELQEQPILVEAVVVHQVKILVLMELVAMAAVVS